MTPLKNCYYCKRPVETEDSIDFCYVINEDESITYTHEECAQMYDGFTVREKMEWIGYDE